MRFTSIALVLGLSALAQSFVIPNDPADGVYTVTTRDDGTEVHTKVADLAATKRDAEADVGVSENVAQVLDRRQNHQVWCGCGYKMDSGNCDSAVAALKGQINGLANIPPNQSYYSIRKNVVAFACNRGGTRSWLVYKSVITDSLARITNKCGRYIAGASINGVLPEGLMVGYQVYYKGADFCKAATASNKHSC